MIKLFKKEAKDTYRILGVKVSFKTRRAIAESRASELLQDTLDLTALEKAKKIIVFLVPGNIKVNGGVMSIFSLCQASREIKKDFFVCLATYPKGRTYLINDNFYNRERILRFNQIVNRAKFVQKMILHIPEYYADDFYNDLNQQGISFLKSIPELQINILNQNIAQMPAPEALQDLYKLTKNITQTIAHDRYSNQEVCDKWNIPTHLFSVNIDLSKYRIFDFEDKERVIALSPDKNGYRERVIEQIKDRLPDWKIVTIHNMTFGQYMDLIARSYFTITFGEGMDGYFNQPAYVGSVGIAVYNEDFFPDDTWKDLVNVYYSYDEIVAKLCDDIKMLSSDKGLYYQVIEKHLEKLKNIYTMNGYIANIERFYNNDYDFVPSSKIKRNK